jgi:hypothetical protein
MEYLTYIVDNEMQKHRVEEHQDEPMLVIVQPGSEKVIDANNDFHFFVHAFTDSGIANGRMRGTGGGNALDISPTMINSKIFKYQMFKGQITIQNFSLSNKLYLELLRVTPIPEN